MPKTYAVALTCPSCFSELRAELGLDAFLALMEILGKSALANECGTDSIVRIVVPVLETLTLPGIISLSDRRTPSSD